MSKLVLQCGVFLGLASLAADAFALGGCVNSPENPSVVLGLLGGGAASLPWLRARIRAGQSKRPRLPERL